jgi:hypothetical protein
MSFPLITTNGRLPRTYGLDLHAVRGGSESSQHCTLDRLGNLLVRRGRCPRNSIVCPSDLDTASWKHVAPLHLRTPAAPAHEAFPVLSRKMSSRVCDAPSSRAPLHPECRTPTESDLRKLSSFRHLEELRLSRRSREASSENTRKLKNTNTFLQTQIVLLEKEHQKTLASTGHHDAVFTGDGTSLDTYVKELTFYKKFGGPASERSQYMKFKS